MIRIKYLKKIYNSLIFRKKILSLQPEIKRIVL